MTPTFVAFGIEQDATMRRGDLPIAPRSSPSPSTGRTMPEPMQGEACRVAASKTDRVAGHSELLRQLNP
jgi:hypothetical protein